MMHAAFGQIAQGAGAYPDNDRPSSAAAQMGTVAHALGGAKADEAVAAWYDSTWAELIKTRDLKAQAHLFIEFALPGSVRLWLWKKALTEIKADGGTIKRMHALFLEKASDALAAQFAADPDKGLTDWQEVLVNNYGLIQQEQITQQFRHEVERRLIEAYVLRAVVALREDMAGISQSKLNAYLEAVRGIVRDHSGKFLLMAVAAVAAWEIPPVKPDSSLTDLARGTEIAGFFSGILLLPVVATPPAAIIVAAVALLAAEKAGTLYVAWNDLKDKEEQYRQAQLSLVLKDALSKGFERKADLIEDNQDLLAATLTVGAIKAGLDFETMAQEPIRTYIWRQIFGDFPQDRTAGREQMMQSLKKDFTARLAGP